MLQIIKFILTTSSLAYILIIIYLYFMQERLIFPGAYSVKNIIKQDEYIAKNIKRIFILTEDNIKLSGATTSNNSDTLLIYFSGNAENSINFVSAMGKFEHFDTVSFNYRGYGQSEGRPGEKNIYDDSLKIFDHFKEQYKDVIIVGKSLGTAVATYISKKRVVKGVVLITPYDSILNVSKDIYPFIPIKLLLMHPFDSVDNIKKVDVPTTILMVKDDEIISNKRSFIFKDQVQNLVLFRMIDNSAHDITFENKNLFEFLTQSVEKIQK